MSHVSIIGGGNMGQAIATIVAKGGNTVEVFNNNDADKPVTGDVVFLAVPYPAVADVLVRRGDQLAGKVVVGITKSPVTFETFDSLVVPADASTAREIASSLPQSRVLKLSASCRSPAPPPTSWHGPADSPSSADGRPGWHRAPDEGSSRWWYLGMFVLVLTLLALLTLLPRA
jgi:predicted dinucleotide-binding enzyme